MNEDWAEGAGEQPQSTDAAFDFTESVNAAGATLDEERAASFGQLLNELGVRDNKAANKLAAFGMDYLKDGLESLPAIREKMYSEETYRHYGCTKENPSSRFNEDFAKVGKALEVLEEKVPGLRGVFTENGLGSNLKVVQAFALIGELVGEDKNFMHGAMSGGDNKAALKDYFPLMAKELGVV